METINFIRAMNYALTTKMSEYIEDGYYVNVRTLQGLQNEVARVDLLKEVNFHMYKFLRLWIERMPFDKYALKIGEKSMTEEDVYAMWTDNPVIWNCDLEVIDTILI